MTHEETKVPTRVVTPTLPLNFLRVVDHPLCLFVCLHDVSSNDRRSRLVSQFPQVDLLILQ